MFTIPINLQRADRVNNISAGQKGRKNQKLHSRAVCVTSLPWRGSLGSVWSLCEQDQPQSSPRAQLPAPHSTQSASPPQRGHQGLLQGQPQPRSAAEQRGLQHLPCSFLPRHSRSGFSALPSIPGAVIQTDSQHCCTPA